MSEQERCREPESMEDFFNIRAATYEQHMEENVDGLDAFYASIAQALPRTSSSPRVLDLGVGTGLELHAFFQRFPNARVTGIDLSRKMLAELEKKGHSWMRQVQLLLGSFLELDLGDSLYDGVISAMALHHWVPEVKLELYRRVHRALVPRGAFVNGDYVEDADEASDRLADHRAAVHCERHHYHIDLPLTCETEMRLLKEAGFAQASLLFRRRRAATFLAIA